MNRLLLSALAVLVLMSSVKAHFVFIVPIGSDKARVVLSEDLEPDSGIDAKRISNTKLHLRSPGQKDTPLTTSPGEHLLNVTIPGKGPRIIFGTSDLGVMERGKGFRLLYHPKVCLGLSDEKLLTLGKSIPAEIVPISTGGKLRFKVFAGGKPQADVEVTVLVPGAEAKKVKTDKDGLTEAFSKPGRYGAWSRVIDATPGKFNGKAYDAVRHYPTLVFDFAAADYPPLPTAVSSLGAVACDGYLYVYGGHAGRTHHYDTKAVVGTFQRLKLNGGTQWEKLPGGPIVQGMNLAAHDGKVYRVGGMQPRNAPGTPSDNHSLADVVRFDPKLGKWESLPAMPAGRSSHDVVVVGNKLVVVGGWQMRGRGEKSTWHETALILDLSAKELKWKSIPQPFKRRALTATVVGSKVYIIGGLSPERTDGRVDILDVNTTKWSQGPSLPAVGGRAMAFSPAAATVENQVVVNTSDGQVYRLKDTGKEWEQVGKASHARMVARMIPLRAKKVLLVGGASRSGNVAELEVVTLAEKGEKVSLE